MKIITKLLAYRLQKLFQHLIHKNQYGFICAITSEKGIIILKLDFKKAFGKIEHQALLNIMRHKGFGEKWLAWMELIFSSGTSSILLNGVLRKTFSVEDLQ